MRFKCWFCFLKAHKAKQGVQECDHNVLCGQMVPVNGKEQDLLRAERRRMGLPDLDMKNISSSCLVGKITLSPNSQLGWWDYFLRCVGLLDLLKGELAETVRRLQGAWRKHSLWPWFSTKISLWEPAGQVAWVPGNRALPCLEDH